MAIGTVVSLGLAVVIGLTLGALGGGGSILTLPIFVFVAGIPTQESVAMSMVVVGGTSLLGAGLHWRRGNLHPKATILFAATGVIGGLLIAKKVPSESLSKAFGWFVIVLSVVIGGLAAAGIRTTSIPS